MDKFKNFIDELGDGNIKKHELKDFINANGFFSKAKANLLTREDATDLLSNSWGDNTITISNSIPEGDSIYIYEGIISQQYGKGERNRNGYKIDKNGRSLDEYSLNPAILLMHDPDKGVIGNMIKVGVTKNGLKGLFWIDTNNISDEGIRNQVKTGTLKATSTGSLVEEYMFEDTTSGKNYNEEKAIELYSEYEVWKAYFGASDQLILNITKSIMIETSLVSIGSNYKAVDGNTINKYFTNLINNKMTEPEKLKLAELQNSENDTEIVDGEEVVTPENGEEATTDDVTEVVEEIVVEPTEKVAEEVAEVVTNEPTQTSEVEELKNQLAKANKELEELKNTPVINTSLSKSVEEKQTISKLDAEKNFLTKTWGK